MLWFYPVFWVAHLVGRLPPGKDHIHQVVFIVLSLVGLLVLVREFFGGTRATGAHWHFVFSAATQPRNSVICNACYILGRD